MANKGLASQTIGTLLHCHFLLSPPPRDLCSFTNKSALCLCPLKIWLLAASIGTLSSPFSLHCTAHHTTKTSGLREVSTHTVAGAIVGKETKENKKPKPPETLLKPKKQKDKQVEQRGELRRARSVHVGSVEMREETRRRTFSGRQTTSTMQSPLGKDRLEAEIEEMSLDELTSEEERHDVSTSGKTKRRRPSSLSGAGDEVLKQDDELAQVRHQLPPMPSPIDASKGQNASNLYANNAVQSLMLPPRSGSIEQLPPSKKARTASPVESDYDSSGSPRMEAYLPQNVAVPGGHPINARGNNFVTIDVHSPPVATRKAPEPSVEGSTSLKQLRSASYLLNKPKLQTTKESFSLIESICRDTDLLRHVVSFLNVPSVVSLYAISKLFHHQFNTHHTAFILSNMRTWAPNADKIYPWRCYKSLCVKDPTGQQKQRLEGKEAQVNKKNDDIRDVPSLRWLQMVVWREGVCRDMLIQLSTQALKCPPGTLDAIKHMWFIHDLPLNAHRIALIRNTDYISNSVLTKLTFFLLKLDMFLTDPSQPPYTFDPTNPRRYPAQFAGGNGSGVALRKMLLAERQLTPLWRVIRGWTWDMTQPQIPMTRLDMLRLWVRHKYQIPADAPENVKRQSIMGIPWHEVGTAGLERTGVSFEDVGGKQVPISHPSILAKGQSGQSIYPHRRRIVLANEKPREQLLRPDELVIRECVRRKMGMHKKWAMMMLWGFCDESGKALPVFNEEQYLRMVKGLTPWVGQRYGGEPEAEL